jgi:hypothetical protein
MSPAERERLLQQQCDEEGCGAILAALKLPFLALDYPVGRYERRDRFWTGEARP